MSRLVSASRVDRHALISTASPHPRPSLSSAMLDKNLYWHPMLLRTPIPASAATSSSTPRPLWHRCYIDPAFPRPRVIKEIGADAVSRPQHHQPSEQRPQQQSETLCKTSGRQTRRLETHFQEKRIAASNPTRLFDSSVDAQPCGYSLKRLKLLHQRRKTRKKSLFDVATTTTPVASCDA
ncbi:hypothetical protein BKA80DRAFT_8933 [Phyllosticta citrichinensis]